MVEMKVALVMVAREFEISAAYEELDARAGGGGPGTVVGERAYQVQMGQPWGNLPCRMQVGAGRAK